MITSNNMFAQNYFNAYENFISEQIVNALADPRESLHIRIQNIAWILTTSNLPLTIKNQIVATIDSPNTPQNARVREIFMGLTEGLISISFREGAETLHFNLKELLNSDLLDCDYFKMALNPAFEEGISHKISLSFLSRHDFEQYLSLKKSVKQGTFDLVKFLKSEDSLICLQISDFLGDHALPSSIRQSAERRFNIAPDDFWGNDELVNQVLNYMQFTGTLGTRGRSLYFILDDPFEISFCKDIELEFDQSNIFRLLAYIENYNACVPEENKIVSPSFTIKLSLIDDGALEQILRLEIPISEIYFDKRCQITDKGIARLKEFRHLKCLSFCQMKNLTNDGLVHLKEIADLEELFFIDCTQITNGQLAHLRGLRIHTLSLSGCSKITDSGLVHLKNMAINWLDLTSCNKITDKGLQHLSSLPLSELKLYRCKKITGKGLVPLLNTSIKANDLRTDIKEIRETWISLRTTTM